MLIGTGGVCDAELFGVPCQWPNTVLARLIHTPVRGADAPVIVNA